MAPVEVAAAPDRTPGCGARNACTGSTARLPDLRAAALAVRVGVERDGAAWFSHSALPQPADLFQIRQMPLSLARRSTSRAIAALDLIGGEVLACLAANPRAPSRTDGAACTPVSRSPEGPYVCWAQFVRARRSSRTRHLAVVDLDGPLLPGKLDDGGIRHPRASLVLHSVLLLPPSPCRSAGHCRAALHRITSQAPQPKRA